MGSYLEHERRKNSFEELDIQGHKSVYFAEPQKAIIAGNYRKGLDCSKRACVTTYLNGKMLFTLTLKNTALMCMQKGCSAFMLLPS